MNTKTHKTAVVIIPPEDLWPPIQAIRQQYDRHVRRWMPHVTMIYPFRPREQFDEIAKQLSERCRSIEPFELQFTQIRDFHHGRQQYTLWLAPEPAEKVVQLQTQLQELVPDCADVRRFKSGFTPHLSVGQVRRKANMTHLRETLQAEWQPLSFVLREVCLIWRVQAPDDIFRVGRKVYLGSSQK